MSRTPTTPEPSTLDRDDIQDILSSFYLGDGTYSDLGSEENEVYHSDSERYVTLLWRLKTTSLNSATKPSYKNRSHSHCGRDELEARELYDLYGDDEGETCEYHDDGDDDGSDLCSSSSSQDSDYDYPPDLSPTTTECPTSLNLPPGNHSRGQFHDPSLSGFDATYTNPKTQDLGMAFEGADDRENVVWGRSDERD